MKIIYSIASIACFTLLYSCKKSFVCTCTTTITEPAYMSVNVNYPSSENSTIDQVSYEKEKEASAEASCTFKEYEITYSSPNEAEGQGLTTEIKVCELNEF